MEKENCLTMTHTLKNGNKITIVEYEKDTAYQLHFHNVKSDRFVKMSLSKEAFEELPFMILDFMKNADAMREKHCKTKESK